MSTSHLKRLPCLGSHFAWVFYSSFEYVTSVYGEKFEWETLLYNSKTEQHPQTNALHIPCSLYPPFLCFLFVQGVDIPWRFLFIDVINILNLSNSILNPFVYALRIAEFRQALRVSCCSRHQDVMNGPGIVGRANMAAVLTPVLQRSARQCNSSQVQQIYRKEVMDTKFWTRILSNALLMNSKCTTGEKKLKDNGLKDLFLVED